MSVLFSLSCLRPHCLITLSNYVQLRSELIAGPACEGHFAVDVALTILLLSTFPPCCQWAHAGGAVSPRHSGPEELWPSAPTAARRPGRRPGGGVGEDCPSGQEQGATGERRDQKMNKKRKLIHTNKAPLWNAAGDQIYTQDDLLLGLFCQGATIRRDEATGAVIVARIMKGGAADRSGEISSVWKT